MKILKIDKDYQRKIEKAAEIIKSGGLVVFPSDTVYILAVDPTNKKGVKKLLEFKNRWTGKAISVAVLNKEMAMEYVKINKNGESIYTNLLPGPFTIVSEGKHRVEKGVEAENGTLGIRIPDNKYIRDLIEILGKPITATSANLSGRTPNYSITSFLRPLSKKKRKMIDLIVNAGKLPKNRPSTVIDATESEIKILRRGDLITGLVTQTFISKSEKETGKIAEFLLKKYLKPTLPSLKNGGSKPIVFLLSGDLGCGKTVFSRKIGHLLGVKDKITSPTFVIYNEYKIDKKTFLHMDLYKITTNRDLEEIKFFNLFKKNIIACIEWPENMGKEKLKKLKKLVNLIPINFRYIDQYTREIKY
ncbi:MAG: L-threonylcarbamoyladenylate synthase [Candidatus Shapirobacteria bacterium]|nr:L-threonylcarbamoyladenylate synthase [Candidatus Shapirobacteria bacterium]